MKRILFSLVVLLSLSLGAQAQQHSCCTAKNKAACEMKVAAVQTPIAPEHQTAAAKMASLDASIESRTNPVTGEVSYVRKTTANDGAVSYVGLNFDPATSTFVNVGPSQVAASTNAANNTQGCGAHAATTSGKSCCAAGAATKSCCAAKAKSASTASAGNANEGKPVKTGGSN